MTTVALLAGLLGLASGAVPPGAQPGSGGTEDGPPALAEGTGRFRYADVRCSVAPAVVKQGEETTLTVTLTPRAGATWHEARLAPSRVEVGSAPGWTTDVSVIDLPPAETPSSPRELALSLRAHGELTGYEVLELRLRYGVRLERPKTNEEEDDGSAGEEGETESGSPRAVLPEVIFEEATLAVELPAAHPATALVTDDEESEGGKAASEPSTWPGPPLPGFEGDVPSGRNERGSPALPATVLAVAAGLVFAGIAIWTRARR